LRLAAISVMFFCHCKQATQAALAAWLRSLMRCWSGHVCRYTIPLCAAAHAMLREVIAEVVRESIAAKHAVETEPCVEAYLATDRNEKKLLNGYFTLVPADAMLSKDVSGLITPRKEWRR
jgi:hypothetical protein